MPQMAPTMWMMLFIMFIMTYMMYIMIMYFFQTHNIKIYYENNMKNQNMNWLW